MNQPSQDALGWPRPLARQAGLGWPVPGDSPETAEDELADEVGAEIQDTDVQRPYFAEPSAEKLPPVSRETAEDPAEAESPAIESTPAVSRETSPDEPANGQVAGDAPDEILGAAISADELGPSGEDDAPAAPPVPRETLPHPAQPRVLVIANQKGGVGKTTTAVNIATALALGDQRVLVVDLDPQGNASTALGVDHEPGTPGTYEVLIEGAAVADHVKPSAEADNLWVLPATVDLAAAEIELVSTVARESRLAKALRRYLRDHDVDYVFLDCPPSLGLLTLNALVAAEEILIPIQCEYYALEGVSQLLNTINLVKGELNDELEVSTVLLTMFDPRTRLAAQVVDEVRAHFPEQTLESVIPRSVRISEAPSYGQTVLTYQPTSTGAICYRRAAAEIAHRAVPEETQ
ncbi:chromosome partitioning protein [Enemella evansiae]|uniref:Chromosome partitioning protein n=1 Tax=Enemella evansiae TaxID=2016499 RepID=A0A255GVY7_9ACTN|nr:chromosome partitioning protein [Enemella evansiae]OYO17404.1 chromosome partitioning protein [Enemella evansiae]TDO91952.1 chromosome segregation ATPase [Enemella evansiae]